MISIQHKFRTWTFFIAALLALSACNKEVEQFVEQSPVTPTGITLGETLATTPDDSLYYKLIVRSGLLPLISNKATTFTMFVPDNGGMRLFINGYLVSSGQPPILSTDNTEFSAVITNIPVEIAAGIVSYNIIGQKLTASQVPDTFPNFQLPTQITLPQPPPANPLVKLTTFPSAKTQLTYVNNIPVTAVDENVANGVIHHVATVVVPPSTVLAELIYTDPNLSYFTAAIARADSGQVDLNRFDSLLKYGVTNMTILAPNNSAFQTLIYGVAYGAAIAQGAPPAVADALANSAVDLGPGIFSDTSYYLILPASSVRGILAYHFLASNSSGSYIPDIRAFSVNFDATPMFVKTLVNAAFDAHPGIMVQASFAGPFVNSLKFTGLGTFPPGGAPYSGPPATAVAFDKHAVNGVLHIIDKVLLPQ